MQYLSPILSLYRDVKQLSSGTAIDSLCLYGARSKILIYICYYRHRTDPSFVSACTLSPMRTAVRVRDIDVKDKRIAYLMFNAQSSDK